MCVLFLDVDHHRAQCVSVVRVSVKYRSFNREPSHISCLAAYASPAPFYAIDPINVPSRDLTSPSSQADAAPLATRSAARPHSHFHTPSREQDLLPEDTSDSVPMSSFPGATENHHPSFRLLASSD